jgi:hypothetical protein
MEHLNYAEKRRHERAPVDIHVYWGWTEACAFGDRMLSISIGGCFLRTSQATELGRQVFIRFWLSGEKMLRGEVRYQIERWGFGVEFKGVTEEDTGQLGEIVEHYRRLSVREAAG